MSVPSIQNGLYKSSPWTPKTFQVKGLCVFAILSVSVFRLFFMDGFAFPTGEQVSIYDGLDANMARLRPNKLRYKSSSKTGSDGFFIAQSYY